MSLTIKIPKKNTSNSVPSLFATQHSSIYLLTTRLQGTEPSNSRRKSTRRRVTTDSEEDDYELSPTHSESKQRRKSAPRVKGQGEREDDFSLRDSARLKDRNQSVGSKRPRDDPLSADEPEGPLDVTVSPDVDSSANATTTASEAVKEESASVSLPPFKKKRLPPIKKNKPSTIPLANVTPTLLATGKPGPVPPEGKVGSSVMPEDSVDTLSVLKRPKRINNQQEVNLNDKSVYESLFKHVRPLSTYSTI